VAADRAQHLGARPLEEADPPVTIRAFFGLPLPEAQRAALTRYLEACTAAVPQVRWTPGANLHLTARFLGQVDPALAESIADRMASSPPPAFTLALGGVGRFSRGRLVRVVWLGVSAGAPELVTVAERLEAECARAALAGEARPFRPHLTLGRSRAREGAVVGELPAPPVLEPWRADELVLYRSRLGRPASSYEALRAIRLR
jgi:RNA 2',3'-cyclic 3'-phosphodiesterase